MDRLDPLLLHCGLHPLQSDLLTLCQATMAQMRIGLYGGHSSLPMRSTHLAFPSPAPTAEAVTVALCTEQEVRTALIRFGPSGVSVVPGDSFPIPGADYPAPLQDLIFGAVALCEPFLKESKHLSLCFHWPLAYRPDGTIELPRPPDALRLTEWEGVSLRAAAEAALRELSLPACHIQVLSAVSAAQLAAQQQRPGESRYLALHWGSSTNAGFSLPESVILKLLSGKNTLRLLDCGLGGLTALPFGTIDLTADRDSLHPGEDLLNKMVSTQSLGELYRTCMIKATEKKLLSFMCGRDFLSLRKLSTEALLKLLDDPNGDHQLAAFCRHEASDLAVAQSVGQAVVQRAARLLCSQVAALLLLGGAGQDPKAPALLALSGEAFAHPTLRHCLTQTMAEELPRVFGLHCTPYENQTLLFEGAALAAFQ